MKKALSVLLTVTMLLGCFSVGFVSFAAPADTTAMVATLKDATTYATQTTFITVNKGEWNENTYVSFPATYSFSKIVRTSVTMPNEAAFMTAAGDDAAYKEKVLTPIINSGEYEKYIDRDELGTAKSIYVEKLAKDSLPLANIVSANGVVSVDPTTCEVGKTGNNNLGEDALKVIDLDASELKNYVDTTGNFTLDDIVLADQTVADFTPAATESSSLAKIVSVISSETANDILEEIRKTDAVKDVTNYQFKITNISVTPNFTTETLSQAKTYGDKEYAAGDTITKITKLDVSYIVEMFGDVRFAFSDVAVPVYAKQTVTSSYSQIKEVIEPIDSSASLARLANVIKAETAAIEATAEDAVPAGYTFSKEVTVDEQLHSTANSVLDDDVNAIIKNIIDDKYGEYGYLKDENGNYYNEELGRYTYDDMLIDAVGLAGNGELVYDGTEYNVSKGVYASEVLGIDALKTMEINTADIKSFNYSSISNDFDITFEDITVYPNDGTDCPLAAVYDNMLPLNLDKELADNFNAATLGSTIEDLTVKYVQPNLAFKYENNELVSIVLNYKISYSANLYLANMVTASPVSGIYNVLVKYENIEKFDKANDIDPYVLANAINDATALIIAEKAGYDFERNASFTDGPNADVSANAIGKVTGVIDIIAGLLGTSVTEKVNNLVSDMLLGDMDVRDYSDNVPVAANGVDYLGEEYALKATCVQANDLTNIKYDANRDVITFELRTQVSPEKDENNALSRLTNDFTSAQDLRDKLSLQLLGMGISFISDDEPCDVIYENIKGYVAFTGSDAGNALGDGTLAALGVSYDCTLDARFSDITINASEKASSAYDDITYFDYEMGDADMSTRVSIVDAKLVLKDVAGLTSLEGRGRQLADMNYDGKIGIADAKKILEKVAGK